jgi:hypothetical protein
VYLTRQYQAELNEALIALPTEDATGKPPTDPQNSNAQRVLAQVREKYQDDPLFRDEIAAQILKPGMDQVSQAFLTSLSARRRTDSAARSRSSPRMAGPTWARLN